MSEHFKQYTAREHAELNLERTNFPDANLKSKKFGTDKKRCCFRINDLKTDEKNYCIKFGYFIGVDWLLENHSSIVVSPKLDSRYESIVEESKNNDAELDDKENYEMDKGKEVAIDYIGLLNQCLAVDFLYKEIDNLVHIDWEANEISIKQEQDMLSPLLVIRFLNVLYSIVRNGLEKSFYQIKQNLNSKVKGKILVAENIKKNVFKNKIVNTYCQFEEFGINSMENRLLKKAFAFAVAYIDNKDKFFNNAYGFAENLINYCRPAFEMVSDDLNVNEIKNYKRNPFYKGYIEGISLAKLLLKRFSYNVSKINGEFYTTPPYWIDMPKLFELYVYYFLKKRFPNGNDVAYQFSTYGNKLDFLLNSDNTQMVIDAKYKPLYIYGKDHQDMRQVSGYARLDKTYNGLRIVDNRTIDCLIIYPDLVNGCDLNEFEIKDLKTTSIKGYKNIFKIGIKLPES